MALMKVCIADAAFTVEMEDKWHLALNQVENHANHCYWAMDRFLPAVAELEKHLPRLWMFLGGDADFETGKTYKSFPRRNCPNWNEDVTASSSIGWDAFVSTDSTATIDLPSALKVLVESVPPAELSSYLCKAAARLYGQLEYLEAQVDGRKNRFEKIVTAGRDLIVRLREFAKDLYSLIERVNKLTADAGLTDWNYKSPYISIPAMATNCKEYSFALSKKDPFDEEFDTETSFDQDATPKADAQVGEEIALSIYQCKRLHVLNLSFPLLLQSYINVSDSDQSLSASVLRFERDMGSSMFKVGRDVVNWAPSLDAALNPVASRVFSAHEQMDVLDTYYFNLVWQVNKASRRFDEPITTVDELMRLYGSAKPEHLTDEE